MDKVLAALGHALAVTGSMTWEILWALILVLELGIILALSMGWAVHCRGVRAT